LGLPDPYCAREPQTGKPHELRGLWRTDTIVVVFETKWLHALGYVANQIQHTGRASISFQMAPSPDPNLGPVMVLVTSVTHAILLPLFAGRLYVRLFPDCRLSWDGYFLIAAVVRT